MIHTTPPQPPIPPGLDARPIVMYTVHCSNCGQALPGEAGEQLYDRDQLPDLRDYGLETDGWRVDVDGRALACPDCRDGWCASCGGELWQWQVPALDEDGFLVHGRCATSAPAVLPTTRG